MDMRRKAMRIWHVGLVLAIAAVVLAGCGAEEATPATADEGSDVVYTSEALDTSYDGALDARNQLMLGTIQLEGTENAVTPGQAQALLPLWQALRGGVTVQTEVAAVLKQIEGTMTSEQLEAIAAMQLTQEGLRAWMQEQGADVSGGFPGAGGGQEVSPEVRATRQAEFGSGEVPPEMATRRAEMENMSDEERAALRATAQAGGGFPGGSEGGAGGGFPGGAGGRAGRGAGQFGILLNPLIELLTQRAAE
jgi:hypothetical protein